MVPKRKKSKTRTRTRRSHLALSAVNYSVCPQCNTAILPHTACGNCGHHFGRTALEVEKKES